jgi:hypothetical protein
VIRVYDEAGNVIETHEQAVDAAVGEQNVRDLRETSFDHTLGAKKWD